MSDTLEEVLERLNWAREETHSLAADLTAWGAKSARLVSGITITPGFRAVVVEISEKFPVAFRARSGTITNEIRSCLDSLASTLSDRKKTGTTAYFPVADNEIAFEEDKRFRERLRRFRTEDRDALLAFRPFAIGKDSKPGNLLIYGLHHADIKRKHHRLLTIATQSSIALVEGSIGEMRSGKNASLNMPGRTKVAELSNDSSAHLAFNGTVIYAEPDVLRGRPLIKTLHDFSDISETIVRSFL